MEWLLIVWGCVYALNHYSVYQPWVDDLSLPSSAFPDGVNEVSLCFWVWILLQGF